MNNPLMPKKIVDRNGKLTTRWVKTDAGATEGKSSIPKPTMAKAAPKKKRAFKPTDNQVNGCSYYVPYQIQNEPYWGTKANRPTSDELLNLPMTAALEKHREGGYRFRVSEVDYYSVMSVARPWDALNLLHRGIRTPEEAVEFLRENNLDHLIHDNAELMENCLRARINPNMGATYIDDVIDYGADPESGADWIRACDQSSIRYRAEEIKDEMLSGKVTYQDLKDVGFTNIKKHDGLGALKTIAEYIIATKEGGDTPVTIEDLKEVLTFSQHIGNRYEVHEGEKIRVYVDTYLLNGRSTHWENYHYLNPSFYGKLLKSDKGYSRQKAVKMTELQGQISRYWGRAAPTTDDELLSSLVDSRLSIDTLKERIPKDPSVVKNKNDLERLLRAAVEDVPSSVSSGWL